MEGVKPYFERFIQAFPGVRALAEADDDRLMKLWEGLGYYNRARNLKKAACVIMESYGGRMPDEYDELAALPGIGSYPAGAIASLAYGTPVPAGPGKVRRVIEEGSVCILEHGNRVGLFRRADSGLLASLYELPNVEGHLTAGEAAEAFGCGAASVEKVEPLPAAKHIFSHVEWHMIGYRVILRDGIPDGYIAAEKEELKSVYALPNAFGRYTKLIK